MSMNETGLALMNGGAAAEMSARLAEMAAKLDIVQQFFRQAMKKDIDYGTISGTNKPTLYKPGAEKLCELYGFAITVAEKEEERDFRSGFYLAKIKIALVHRGTGVLVAEGVGEASVYESKYRWRWVFESELPAGVERNTLQRKVYEPKDREPYYKYRVENADLFDQWNTVLKMAKKRALVDAVLSATRSSGIFSQSEDEFEAYIEDDHAAPGSGQPREDKYSELRKMKEWKENVSFGKYKGKTVGDMFIEDRNYFDWVVENAQSEKLKKACRAVQAAAAGSAPPFQANSQASDLSLPGDDDAPPLFNDEGGDI